VSSAQANQDFEFAALAEAKNYRTALIREFSAFLRGRVLEVGAGVGQMTTLLAQQSAVSEVMAVEPERKIYRRLSSLFAEGHTASWNGGTGRVEAVECDSEH
jgi:16S rRNA A1518/A1519 N6-dimethyltransferase RsmA/KsgA/DIM1 with predicted DNA glycosylase/AP lyase activity